MVLQNSVHMFLTLNCVLTGLVKQTVHLTNVQARDNYGRFSRCILRVATKNPCKCRLSNAPATSVEKRSNEISGFCHYNDEYLSLLGCNAVKPADVSETRTGSVFRAFSLRGLVIIHQSTWHNVTQDLQLMKSNKKDKAIPVQVWTDSQISRLSALGTGRLYPQQIFLVIIYVRGSVDPRGGRIMSMKTFNNTIGNRTRNLLARMPQPAAPPRAAPLYSLRSNEHSGTFLIL